MTRARAFYASSGSRWRDIVTLLHPPYTMWHLSHVAIGAAIAPALDPTRLAGTLLAFLFGLGLGAHALDEVSGRPLQTGLSDRSLWILGVGGLGVGGLIGIVGAFVISPVVIIWALLGMALAAGYALEWSSLIHSDWGFAIAWGAFPVLVGYWAQTEALAVGALLVAAAAGAVSKAQRSLSTPARRLRRSGAPHEGVRVGEDELLDMWERPLRLLSVAMPLLALGLLALHL